MGFFMDFIHRAKLDLWRTHDEEADFVVHRVHKKHRRYVFSLGKSNVRHIAVLLGSGLCCLVFSVSAIKLVTYVKDYYASRQATEALRNAYYTEQFTPAAATAVSATLSSAECTSTPSPEVAFPQNPTAMPADRLEEAKYPYNPYNIVSARFLKLREQNNDIIGWLKVDGIVDEAVVQRDNEYYLDRDYRGYHNANGAIFLDENCDLSARPYTYLLYGHNMKSGLMFGGLRNYEDITFYRSNPFVTFDTVYEDGRYVIFAVATVSIDPANWRYVDFTKLHSPVIATRQQALQTLIYRSRYECTIDVQTQDQLLLLVTCVGDDAERRVVAARRIREDETETALRRMVRKTTIR